MRVRAVTSAADIPEDVWRDLAPAEDPLWNRALMLAMERCAIGPDRYRYLVAEGDRGIEAVLPVCVFDGLPLEDIVGAEGRRPLRLVRRVMGRPLRIRLTLCGHLLGEGRVLRGPDAPASAAAALVGAAMDLAEQLDSRWIVFKDFGEHDLSWLRDALAAAGFFTAPGLPDAVLSVRADSFDDYVRGLSRNSRKSVRAKLRTFGECEQARLEVRDDFGDLVVAMMPLYESVLSRAESQLDVWTPQFLAALSEDPDIPTKLVACWHGERLAGFLLNLLTDGGAVACRVGLDYAVAGELQLYQILHYRSIDEMIGNGLHTINFMQTAYEPKRRLGCHLVPLVHAVNHRNRFVRIVLRRFLQFALNQSGDDARLEGRSWAAAPPAIRT